MGQIILLAVALRFFTRHIFQYEKISRLEMVIVPAYTLIMGCVLIIKRPPALLPLVLTVVIGALVGWFQATGLVLQVTDEQDENHLFPGTVRELLAAGQHPLGKGSHCRLLPADRNANHEDVGVLDGFTDSGKLIVGPIFSRRGYWALHQADSAIVLTGQQLISECLDALIRRCTGIQK